MMGSVDCLKDIATSLDLFFKGLSDCGLLSVYEVPQFLERDMLDITSRMKFKTVVCEFLSNMRKSLKNNLGEDDLLLIEELTSDEIFGEFILPGGITIVPQLTDTNENGQMASLNISAISPDDAIIIEESDFDEIFDERITVVSESTNVSENQPNNTSNIYVENTARVTHSDLNHFKAGDTEPLDEVLRMMYSDKERSDITEPWQISILENEEVDTKIDTITEVLTKNHLTDVGWQCDMCNKVFQKMVDLQHHCREEHNGTGCFECNLCNARLMTKLSLKRHIRSHSGIKSNTCDICLKSFKRADYLTTHYKLHQGARPHKCHVCLKEFTTKTGLQVHEKVHSDQKDYICHQCSKSFTRRDKLRDHVLRHLKIKRFQCSICDKRYAEKRDLRTHLKVHDQ